MLQRSPAPILLTAVFPLASALTTSYTNSTTIPSSTTLQSLVTAPATLSSSFSNSSIAWETSGVNPILSLAKEECQFYDPDTGLQNVAPCIAFCPENIEGCIETASSQASTCSPQWDAYLSSSSSWALINRPGPTLFTETALATETLMSFSSSLTDTDYVVTDELTGETANPVYLLGDPSVSTSYDSYTFTWSYTAGDPLTTVITVEQPDFESNVLSTSTLSTVLPVTSGGFPLPTPYCRYTSAYTATCGQCTIKGGSVQVFYWPEATSTASASVSKLTGYANSTTTSSNVTVTTVVSGVTMTSPSVYVSLQTVYALDLCSEVGNNFKSSIIAMDPDQVSTVYGVGAQGYQPNLAAQFNFADLQGLVPASVYEESNNCARFGCFEIENNLYRPTLSIPPQIRTLDPLWASCALNLDGFYDPPSALTGGSTVAGVTLPNQQTTTNDAQQTPAAPSPTQTNGQSPQTSGDSQPAQTSADPAPAQSDVLASTSPNDPAQASATPNNQPQAASSQGDPSNGASTSNADPAGVIASVIGLTKSADPADPATSGNSNAGQAGSSAAVTPQQVVVAGSTVSGAYSVASGVTLSAGGSAATVSGSVISLASSGNSVVAVVNGITQAPAAASGQTLSLAQSVSTLANSGGYVVDGQTLTNGGAITVSGSTISLGPSGSYVVVNGATQTLDPGATPANVVTYGTQAFTENSAGAIVVNGQTLTPGQAVTADGSTLSVGPSGSYIVVNGVTEAQHDATPALTVGSEIITENSNSQYVVDGQTLVSGSLVTLGSGTAKTTLRLFVTNGLTEVAFGTSSTEILGMADSATTSSADPSTASGSGKPAATTTKKKSSGSSLAAVTWSGALVMGTVCLIGLL